MGREQKWIYNGVEFKAGDRVIIHKIVDEQENGMGLGVDWNNCWVDSMNALIGNEYEINHIDERGVFFVTSIDDPRYIDDEGYGFPLGSLALVSELEIYG